MIKNDFSTSKSFSDHRRDFIIVIILNHIMMKWKKCKEFRRINSWNIPVLIIDEIFLIKSWQIAKFSLVLRQKCLRNTPIIEHITCISISIVEVYTVYYILYMVSHLTLIFRIPSHREDGIHVISSYFFRDHAHAGVSLFERGQGGCK